MTETEDRLIDAILGHVVFDGWSDTSFDAAVAETGVDPVVARGLFPRGARDLARAWHDRGDDRMVAAMEAADLSDLRYSEKVAQAVWLRIEAVDDKEALRRAMVQNVLPLNAPDGARMLWQTADRIWTLLGDSSDDYNWYTKRMTLSGVIGSTLLFWLGDDTPDASATRDFLDRRIENVMQFEKLKSRVTSGPLGRALNAPGSLLSMIRPPRPRDDLPGRSH
ncbi:COQ9 family protein [Pseudooceanicola nitratireducens]|uniref:COQ9 family protein n=1 Tax=Pseudooceanicola nitratireducens TaxID=517719 RepID=UPI001C9648BB|nr:COQ9 family protein [Pseudooceanicola nitratireducens]MBY6164565.1 COQ9 family protein [Pseudooceanicola nitratireducens]